MHAETPATKVFSSCGVALLHAWLPEAGSALAAKLGSRSYEAVQEACLREGQEEQDLELVDWLTNRPPWLLTEAGHRSVLQAMAGAPAAQSRAQRTGCSGWAAGHSCCSSRPARE